MAFYLLYAGYKVVRFAFGGLLDEYDESSLKLLAEAIEKNRIPGIIDIHQTRMIRAGRFHHIDAHLVIPEFWDVSEAHQKTNEFENDVVSSYPLEGEIAFHLDPCLKFYCTQCDLDSCPIRIQKFNQREPVTSRSLVKKPLLPVPYINN
jgi:divalent metal cation (Fe/Co/Zn/Cd) transporter